MLKKIVNKFQVYLKMIKMMLIFSTKAEWLRCYFDLTDYSSDCNLTTKEGVILSIADKDGFGIVNEIFYDQTYTKHRKIRENETVIDIGANLGAFTLFASTQAKNVRVLSFEPMLENYERLRKNISQNGLEKNVSCFCMAVAKDTLGRKLFTGNAKGHHTTTPTRKNLPFDYTQSHVNEVPSTTLEDIIKTNKLEGSIFLKMDCEGGEYEIILETPDAYLSKISYMALEYHSGSELLETRLKKAGYSIEKELYDSNCGILYANKIPVNSA